MATRTNTHRKLILVERALFLVGFLCLAWVYANWRQADVYQQQARKALSGPAAVSERIARDSLIGMLDVPRIGLSVAMREGDEGLALRTAVGHLPDTPLPWHAGNAAFAGHRDTFFRPLQYLRVGDEMQLTTPRGTFRYSVRRMFIVEPHEIHVLDDSEGVSLTLITCYPFTYVGHAPKRFVVQAERIAEKASAGE